MLPSILIDMHLSIFSDLHIDYQRNPKLANQKTNYIKSIVNDSDGLIFCGDNAEKESSEIFFKQIRNETNLPIGFILGNHEVMGPTLRKGVTLNYLDEKFIEFDDLANTFSLIHLEKENLMLNDLTISGTYGHYDGSLSNDRFSTDKNTVNSLIDRLETRIKNIERKIIITHTVPNKEMIGRPDGLIQDKYTPFAGSLSIEDSIKYTKPILHFCGHTHAYAKTKIGETDSYNVGSDYDNICQLNLDTETMFIEKKITKFSL
jgi:Icc-related predicted phosphoesterase